MDRQNPDPRDVKADYSKLDVIMASTLPHVRDRENQHIQFVALLWRIKRRLSNFDNSPVNLSMLINSVEYRNDVLRKALKTKDKELHSLIKIVLSFNNGNSPSSRQKHTSVAGAAGHLRKRSAAASGRQANQPSAARPQYLWASVLVFAGMLLAFTIGALGYFLGQHGEQAVNDKLTTAPVGAQTASAPAVASPPPAAKVAAIAPVTPVPSSSPLPDPNPRTVLRIVGSNTVGAELSPALVEAYLKSIGATDTLIVTNESTPNEHSVQAMLPEEDGVIEVEIQAHGSGTAFTGLVANTADMGQSSRPVKDKEAALLEPTHGDMTSQAREHVIGLDGLAVIIHPSNPIDQLTIDQLAALFSGQITDWSKIGGKPGKVNVYARDDKSGTYDTFKQLVLKRHDVELTEKSRRYESNERLSDELSVDPFGIGFCSLPYVGNSKLLAIADSSDSMAIIPTAFTIGTEDYPLSRRLFFYTPANTHNKHIHNLTEFTLSEPGQEIVMEVGFISQNIYSEKPVLPDDAPDEYKELTNNAERLSLNFRFKTGMIELDNKSVRDINRLVDFMYKKEYRARQLMLFGFTDSVGSFSHNLALSDKRAHVVEQFLTASGLSPTVVKGYGMILPVASNTTELGRNKNRRVEVWVK